MKNEKVKKLIEYSQTLIAILSFAGLILATYISYRLAPLIQNLATVTQQAQADHTVLEKHIDLDNQIQSALPVINQHVTDIDARTQTMQNEFETFIFHK